METQTMTAENRTAKINSIGGCGCDSDVRAFLSNDTSIQLDAYSDRAIPQHRNCGGDLAHNGTQVFCTKCDKTLLDLKTDGKTSQKEDLISSICRSWMENYPEAGAGNTMKCTSFNYDKMEFTFVDEETGEYASVNLKTLKKGFNVLLQAILDGKYHNSIGAIPHILAEGYEDDAQDHDALVQCVVFKEVRYG
ncbi:MAG: hypothetical protein AAB706_00625 [Patescibacteria group bacterium]